MIRKLFSRNLTNYRQQVRCIGKREVNIKNPQKEAELPIFQYNVSKTSDRRVYVWGFSDTGALGLGLRETNKRSGLISSPKRLSFAERFDIIDAECGFGFTIYAIKSSDENKVFGTGLNTDSQIGSHILRNNKIENVLFYPSPIVLPIQKDTEILKLSAGRAHVIILTNQGLFSLGNNSYGQCGRTIVQDENYVGNSFVHHTPNINGQKIIDVQCGQDHSLILNENGEVFGCGWGADGQTGLGHYNNESKFTKLVGDIKGEKIIKLSSVGDCALAINEKGDMFGWGNSEYGQILSDSDEQQISVPIKLKHPNIGKVVDVAAGGSFCLALNDEGSVFVWGYGLLGKGPEVQQAKLPTQIPSALFGCNDFQPDTKVTSICSGLSHMAAVTNTGDLYMWGKNRHGCLGLGHKNDQFFPLRVSIGASVQKVSCGLDHTIAICKPFI